MLSSLRLAVIRALGAVPVEDVTLVVNTAVEGLRPPIPYVPPKLQGAHVPPSFPSLATAKAEAEILLVASHAASLADALAGALYKGK